MLTPDQVTNKMGNTRYSDRKLVCPVWVSAFLARPSDCRLGCTFQLPIAHTSGFGGVHTRRNYLILHIRSDHLIDSPRITKSEQLSKSRYHQEVKLQSLDEVDAELLSWLKVAYNLSN